MSRRDVTIARDEEHGNVVRMTSRTGSVRRFLGDLKKVTELKLDAERGGLTFGGSLRRAEFARYGRRTDGGG